MRRFKISVSIFLIAFTISIGVMSIYAATQATLSSTATIQSKSELVLQSDSNGYYIEMGEYPQTFLGYVDSDNNAYYYTSSTSTTTITMTETTETFTYYDPEYELDSSEESFITVPVYTCTVNNTAYRCIQYTAAGYRAEYYYKAYNSVSSTSGIDTYFILEPIKWRVLGYYEDSNYTNKVVDGKASFVKVTTVSESNKATLLAHMDSIVVRSEYGLEGAVWQSTSSSDGSSYEYGIDVDFPNSTIYKYLQAFLSNTLADYDQYIAYRTIDYNDTDKTTSATDTGAYTVETKIWLMSYTEASSVFYTSSDQRKSQATDFGMATGAYDSSRYSYSSSSTTRWYLRTSYYYTKDLVGYVASTVDTDGSFSQQFFNYWNFGIFPCMIIDFTGSSSSSVTVEIMGDDNGYYVEMGEYPQTFAGYVSDSTLSLTDTGKDFTYIARDGSVATANIYEDSDGNRYIQYTVATSNTATFYDGTTVTDAYVGWFKLEPIKWRILGYYVDSSHTNGVTDSSSSFVQVTTVSDSNYNLLVAHSDALVVQSELALEGVVWYTSNTDVNYNKSTVFKWLDNFYSYILQDYSAYISYRTIDYNDTDETTSSDTDTGAFTTSERIWLMSYTEAGVFYSSASSRLCSPSDFALATNLYLNTGVTSTYRTGTTIYWLRSSYYNSSYYYARGVTSGGEQSKVDYVSSRYAVRPCMLLDLSENYSVSTSYGEILSDDNGYYVYMGEYPQTFAGYVSDTSYTLTDKDFTYVTGTGSTATADVYADSYGNRYIQYTATVYQTSYTFADGTTAASSSAYFKIEPIKWRILGYYSDSSHTNGVTDSSSTFVQVTTISDSNYNLLVAHSDALVVQSELGLEGVKWSTTYTDVDYIDSTIYT